MARRLLDSAFWDDPDVARLSMAERLLFVCMITDSSLSDDYGVLPASPAILKKHAFGYDACTVEEVCQWRDNLLATCPNVILFEHHGQEFIYLRNFEKWQNMKYRRQSNYPKPPLELQEISETSENIPETSENISPDSANISHVLCSVAIEKCSSSGVLAVPAPAAAASDEQTAEIARYCEAMFGLNGINRERIADYIAEYGLERTLYAFKEAFDANARNWRYIEAVFEGSGRNGGSPRASPETPPPKHADPVAFINPTTGLTERLGADGKYHTTPP